MNNIVPVPVNILTLHTHVAFIDIFISKHKNSKDIPQSSFTINYRDYYT